MRAVLAVALVLALALPAFACSDDDGVEATTPTTTTVAPGVPIEVDGRPAAAAVALGDLWVASDGEDDQVGRVRRYDTETGTRLAVHEVGRHPVAVVPIPDVGVWTIGATGLITRIEASGPDVALTTVDLQGALVDGVLAGGRLWVADIGGSVVHVRDPVTGARAGEPVLVEAGAVRLLVAGDRIWVSGLEDQVTPIDLATATVGVPVTVGQAPIGMAVAGGVLLVANSDDGTVSRLDPVTGARVGPPVPVGRAPIAIAPNGDLAQVLNQDDPSVAVIDAATGTVLDAGHPLPMRPRGLAPISGGVWIVGVDPSVAVLDLTVTPR